jgi:hypothetical protein
MSTNGNVYTSSQGNISSNGNTPVRSLVDIQVFPRNKEYDMTVVTGQNDKYYCLAYYSDNTVVDVTSTAVFSVTTSSGATPSSAHFSTTVLNELVINNSATENLLIQATFGGQTDSPTALVYNN